MISPVVNIWHCHHHHVIVIVFVFYSESAWNKPFYPRVGDIITLNNQYYNNRNGRSVYRERTHTF